MVEAGTVTIYVIRNMNDKRLFWRTREGWDIFKNATAFEGGQRNHVPLPPWGEWLEITSPIPRVEGHRA